MTKPLGYVAAGLAATTLVLFSLFGPASAHVTTVPHTLKHIKAKMAYEVVLVDIVVAAGAFVETTANCPIGKEVLGGGAQVIGEGSGDFSTVIEESAPGTVGGGNRSLWFVAIRNHDTVEHAVGIFAVCADVA